FGNVLTSGERGADPDPDKAAEDRRREGRFSVVRFDFGAPAAQADGLRLRADVDDLAPAEALPGAPRAAEGDGAGLTDAQRVAPGVTAGQEEPGRSTDEEPEAVHLGILRAERRRDAHAEPQPVEGAPHEELG